MSDENLNMHLHAALHEVNVESEFLANELATVK